MPRARKLSPVPSRDVYEWNGLTKGAPVVVKGHSPKQWTFTFWSITPDEDGNAKSVCVIGGTNGNSQFRHFLPEKVTAKQPEKPKKTRSRKVTKDEAA